MIHLVGFGHSYIGPLSLDWLSDLIVYLTPLLRGGQILHAEIEGIEAPDLGRVVPIQISLVVCLGGDSREWTSIGSDTLQGYRIWWLARSEGINFLAQLSCPRFRVLASSFSRDEPD